MKRGPRLIGTILALLLAALPPILMSNQASHVQEFNDWPCALTPTHIPPDDQDLSVVSLEDPESGGDSDKGFVLQEPAASRLRPDQGTSEISLFTSTTALDGPSQPISDWSSFKLAAKVAYHFAAETISSLFSGTSPESGSHANINVNVDVLVSESDSGAMHDKVETTNEEEAPSPVVFNESTSRKSRTDAKEATTEKAVQAEEQDQASLGSALCDKNTFSLLDWSAYADKLSLISNWILDRWLGVAGGILVASIAFICVRKKGKKQTL